jgi:hypothetical protein
MRTKGSLSERRRRIACAGIARDAGFGLRHTYEDPYAQAEARQQKRGHARALAIPPWNTRRPQMSSLSVERGTNGTPDFDYYGLQLASVSPCFPKFVMNGKRDSFAHTTCDKPSLISLNNPRRIRANSSDFSSAVRLLSVEATRKSPISQYIKINLQT